MGKIVDHRDSVYWAIKTYGIQLTMFNGLLTKYVWIFRPIVLDPNNVAKNIQIVFRMSTTSLVAHKGFVDAYKKSGKPLRGILSTKTYW